MIKKLELLESPKVLEEVPVLKFGTASLKKKASAKGIVTKVDVRAVEYHQFIKQVDMFGVIWNIFEDNRGWIWSQEQY